MHPEPRNDTVGCGKHSEALHAVGKLHPIAMVDRAAMGAAFHNFLAPLGRDQHIHVLTDSDADGLPAAALLVRALRMSGYRSVSAQVRQKTESAWSDSVIDRLRVVEPDALMIVDLGSRAEGLLAGVPTLLIDHHKPTGVPPGATLLTGYRELAPGEDGKSIPTSGLMAWYCAQSLIGEAGAEPIHDLLWLAAISLISDLGDKAPFPELAVAEKQYGGTALREVTSLLNAPRRSASGDATAALELLLLADSPKQILTSSDPKIAKRRETLLAAKSEVGEALAIARKLPPKFSTAVRAELGADLVAIRMHTPCQVHPLVAQQWRARFPKSVIFGVNTGFRPGWVHFSGRAPTGVNLIHFLAAHRPTEADGAYGNGHDQAAGGALPVPVWNRFARELGFGSDMYVEGTHQDAS